MEILLPRMKYTHEIVGSHGGTLLPECDPGACSGSKIPRVYRPYSTITYHNALVCHTKILHKRCLQFLLGVKMTLTETENNAYAKFWGDKHRALWCVMVFYVVVNQNMIRYSPEAFDPHGLQVF